MLSLNQVYIFILIVVTDVFDLYSSAVNAATGVESYIWKYHKTENSGCQQCIRKCCKPGYFLNELNTTLCVRRTKYSVKLPIYEYGTTYVGDVIDPDSFIVGPIDCDYFILNNSVFNVQTDGSVWVSSFSTFISNDQYCIDEGDDFIILICFNSESTSPNVIGR